MEDFNVAGLHINVIEYENRLEKFIAEKYDVALGIKPEDIGKATITSGLQMGSSNGGITRALLKNLK